MGGGIVLRSQESGHQQKLKPCWIMLRGIGAPWRKCDPCQRCPRERRERGRCTLVSLFQSSPSDSPGSQLPGSQKTRGPGEGNSQSRAEEGFRMGLTAGGQLASSGLSAVGSTADHVDGA